MLFYGGLAGLLLLVAVILAVPLLITYLDTGLVPRFPTAILATGMVIVAVLSFFAGLILDTVTRGRREMRRTPTWPIQRHLWPKSNSRASKAKGAIPAAD